MNKITYFVLLKLTFNRSSDRRCYVKKVLFKISRKFTGKHLCWNLLFNKAAAKKRDFKTVFYYEFCEIFKNTFGRLLLPLKCLMFSKCFRAIISRKWFIQFVPIFPSTPFMYLALIFIERLK